MIDFNHNVPYSLFERVQQEKENKVIEVIYLAYLGICLALAMGFMLIVLGCAQLVLSYFRKGSLRHNTYPLKPDQLLPEGEYPADQA